jgi:equilibrative nucleoside transporter 1/2/3
MITATPYFLSRVDRKLSPTMASYISIVFTASNFVFLAQATATSRQVCIGCLNERPLALTFVQASNRIRTRWTLTVLSVLVFILFLTTYIQFSPFMFAVIVLSTSALQAVAGSYLQTAVIAAAALFGPIAMQSLMSGQAAVGVALSAVQLISAYGSVHIPSATSDNVILQDDSSARAARAFFGLSTLFLIGTILVHAWMVRLPAYVAISDQLDVPTTQEHSPESHARPESERAQIIRIAKANWVYEVAVALVMTVTLVFSPLDLATMLVLTVCMFIVSLPTHYRGCQTFEPEYTPTALHVRTLLSVQYR